MEIRAHVIDIPVSIYEEQSNWGRTVLLKSVPQDATAQEILEIASNIGSVAQIRYFPTSRYAHIMFASVKDAITFMEVAFEKDLDHQPGFQTFHVTVNPSWDTPVVVFDNLPMGCTGQDILEMIYYRVKKVEIRRFLLEPSMTNSGKAIIEFTSQRWARAVFSAHKKKPLAIHCTPVSISYDNPPAIRINDTCGLLDKEKVKRAFDKEDQEHIIGIVLFSKFGYVFFDYRSNMEKAFLSKKETGLKVKFGNSVKYLTIMDVKKFATSRFS